MTHVPPHKILSNENCGDPKLVERLKSLKNPPMFHCFGHDHSNYGMAFNKLGLNITYVNSA